MSRVKELLDELQIREKEIFTQKVNKSGLSAKDITEVGKELGIKFPASYKEYLRTYQIPTTKVFICFCGDTYTNSFDITFSRTENKYIDSDADEIVIELNWINYDTSSKEAFVKSFIEKNEGTMAWAKSGFFLLGEFRGYQVYLDSKEDIVYSIYHEDLLESEDYDDPKAARECIEEHAHELCDNFEQFLKVICSGKPFDEDEHVFYGDELAEEKPAENQADLSSWLIKIGEASATPIKNQDKIGGFPTYQPEEIPVADPYGGHFLMEIYNHGFADPEIICWQLYCMEMSAASITHILEIRKDAPLYDDSSKLISKRMGLNEYPLFLEPYDSKKLDETVSRIGGKVPKSAKNAFKRKKITYLGTITEKLVPNKELNIYHYNDNGIIAFGFDDNGKFYAEAYV